MGKAPRDPRKIFEDLTADYRKLFGEDLVSIILYGSGAGPDYAPGRSDINFLIVLTEEGIQRLDRAFDAVAKWRKRKVSIPLFVTEQYVEASLDTFPVEYLNFQHSYVLVYGKDVLKDLSFEPEYVRLQCEREIKGKLLLLRESFLESRGNFRILREVISQSLRAFLALFRALLYLKGQGISGGKREVLEAACQAFGLDHGLFLKMADLGEGKVKFSKQETLELFRRYLEEIRKLSKIVDTFGG